MTFNETDIQKATYIIQEITGKTPCQKEAEELLNIVYATGGDFSETALRKYADTIYSK